MTAGRAPSPYGALENDAPDPRPVGRRPARRGRRRGDVTGDMEIRPARAGLWVAVIGWVATSAYAVLEIRDLPVNAVIVGLAALAWSPMALQVLLGRVRVVGDRVHVRTLGRHRWVALAELQAAPAVHAKTEGVTQLHLRLHGRHLATLGAIIWGSASVEMLAQRLGAVRLRGSRAKLERDYPGSLGLRQRHPGWSALVIVVAVVAAIVVVVLVTG